MFKLQVGFDYYLTIEYNIGNNSIETGGKLDEQYRPALH